jgi:hypothetical protein
VEAVFAFLQTRDIMRLAAVSHGVRRQALEHVRDVGACIRTVVDRGAPSCFGM